MNLVKYRKKLGKTQREMAEHLDIPYWTYVKYEGGNRGRSWGRKPGRLLAENIELKEKVAELTKKYEEWGA